MGHEQTINPIDLKPTPLDPPSAELTRRFSVHEVTAEKDAMMAILRSKALDMAHLIERQAPPGREAAEAIKNIEQAVFWANAAMARPTQGEAGRDLSMRSPK